MIVIDKSIIIPGSNFFIEFIDKSKSKEITKKSKVDQLIECSSFSRLCIDDKFVFIDNKHFIFQKIIDMNISKIDKVKSLFKLEEDYIHWFNKISKEIDFEIFDDNYVILYTFVDILPIALLSE